MEKNFIPKIFCSDSEISERQSNPQRGLNQLSSSIIDYINDYLEKKIPSSFEKQNFEIFDQEDIRISFNKTLTDLQQQVEDCVKKTGDFVSGPLHLLKPPQAKLEAVNKEYVDWLFSALHEELKTKISNTFDVDLKHYRIINLAYPENVGDAVNKNYVDEKFEMVSETIKSEPIRENVIFSKGQNMIKKTFFFNPGFVCPRRIRVTSVGFSTSPYKFKIGEKPKLGDKNPTKLFFMVNQEIKSEFVVEKDIQLGYILKEFETPIIFEKEDNVMMVVESILEDSSVNLSFLD